MNQCGKTLMTLTTKFGKRYFLANSLEMGKKKDNKTQTPMACEKLVLRLYEVFTIVTLNKNITLSQY